MRIEPVSVNDYIDVRVAYEKALIINDDSEPLKSALREALFEAELLGYAAFLEGWEKQQIPKLMSSCSPLERVWQEGWNFAETNSRL